MTRDSFMAGLEPEVRRALLGRGARKLYTKGSTIFREGLASDSMFLIETGRADVLRTAITGRILLLGQLGPGDLAGEVGLLDRGPRSASVVAATPMTGVLLTYNQVRGFMLEHPAVMFGVLAELVGKLRAANSLAENRSLDDGAARLAAAVLGLAERWGTPRAEGGVHIREKITQGALGQLANLSRESVNRRIRAWERDGWILRHDSELTILQPDFLKRIAETSGSDD